MREALASGAVILGRAGGAAFSKEPGVLRVRLFGPPEARIAQAARIENVDMLPPVSACPTSTAPARSTSAACTA